MISRQDHCDKVLQLWGTIREKTYWIIVNIVRERALSEDVIQEALISAIDKYQTLRDESKFEAWFLTIAIRKAYEVLAKRKNYVDIADIDDGSFFSDEHFDESIRYLDYKDLITYILTHLHPETKKYLFYLRYIEDRPIEDIVQITGLKEGTIKSMFFRMKKELAKLLGKEFA